MNGVVGPWDFIVSINNCCYVKIIFVKPKKILKPLEEACGVGYSECDVVVTDAETGTTVLVELGTVLA